jgi:hypothetical protein
LGGKADHLAQECGIGALLQKRTKGDLLVGHRGDPRVRVACCNPTLLRIAAVAADRLLHHHQGHDQVSGRSTTLLQYRQQMFGRLQICRNQAFHNTFEYGLKNRPGASSFFSQNRSAYDAQQAFARGATRVSNAPKADRLGPIW